MSCHQFVFKGTIMSTIIKKFRLYFLILAGSVSFLLIYDSHGKAEENSEIQSGALADKQIAGFQTKLLDLAFKTATAIPVNPHIKDRSKAQEAVVKACLELNQPARALTYIEQIEGWQQGSCYADLAFYCVQH